MWKGISGYDLLSIAAGEEQQHSKVVVMVCGDGGCDGVWL
jgi:hypothetical protein